MHCPQSKNVLHVNVFPVYFLKLHFFLISLNEKVKQCPLADWLWITGFLVEDFDNSWEMGNRVTVF